MQAGVSFRSPHQADRESHLWSFWLRSPSIALYFHVSTDYLLLGRELDRDSVRASLLELSAQMTELAGKL